MRKPTPWIVPAVCNLAIIFILVSAFGPCAPSQQDLTPLEIAQAQVQKIMDAYIIVYDRTMRTTLNPNITESEKKIVLATKRALDRAWPSLVRCLEMIEEGKIPSKIDLDTADDVLDLLEGAIQ